jgi:hypothetical protein
MDSSVSRAKRGLALLCLLCFALPIGTGCEQTAAHEEEAADGFPELSFGHDEIMESWTLEEGFYVSPRLEAPLGATRVGVLLGTLEPDAEMPALEARAAEGGVWVEVLGTWSEEGVHVGTAELAGGATAVQVRIDASLVDAITMISFNAVIPVDPDVTPGEELGPEDTLPEAGEVGLATEDLRSDLASLGVRSRSQWGARRGRCTGRDGRRYRFAIHHTVSPQTGNVAAMVRGFQRYHMDSNGWCDIGYHFLIGGDGTIYEGRPLEQLGAHVGGHNSGNIGIAFVGCFDGVCPRSYGSRTPSEAAVRAAGRLVHRLSRIYGISVSSRNLLGHRQHSGQSTSCPGSQLLARLDTIRSIGRSGGGGGSSGGTTSPPRELTTPATVAVRWSRGSDRTYTFDASAPSAVVRVDYYVDGWRIGTVRRSASSSLRIRYRFSSEVRNRRFEARGYNAAGSIVARGYGLIEPVASSAVSIRQTGHASYEFSVERPPSGARSLEVRVDDGFVLRDSVSGQTRSTRMAVRYQFLGLRTRPFEIRVLDASGRVIRTERRTFTLR